MKVMALDGNSLVYRAFFALPDTMATAGGEVTNAVFGFCSMFLTLVKDHNPDAVVVVFDRKEKTFRHEAAPEYKAQREKQPDSLYAQLDVVRTQLLPAAGVATLDIAGFEGDDIIATIAAAVGQQDELIIVTGDRDAYQLVSDPNVRVLYNKRGVSDYALYDEAGIKERTGVTPAQYPDYAALRGDPSDNLHGVPGVGEKTAAKLINQYGNLQAVFDAADDQTPKLRASLHEARDRVIRNAGLMLLRRDVPVDLQQSAWVPQPNSTALQALFARLEFSTMLVRWKPIFTKFGGAAAAVVVDTVTAASNAVNTVTEVATNEAISVTLAPMSVTQAVALLSQPAPIGVAMAWAGEPGRSTITNAFFTADGVACGVLSASDLAEPQLREALANSTNVVMHDARNIMRGLLASGVDVKNLRYDTAIAAYLADSGSGSYDIGTVAERWVGRSLEATSGVASGQLNFVDDDAAQRDCALEAAVAFLARQPLEQHLASVLLGDL